MNADNYESVHVTLADGRSIYWPEGNYSRYAPAAVCQVSMRIKMLRKILKVHDMSAELKRDLEMLVKPLPFEEEFDSQCSITVHNAIKKMWVKSRMEEEGVTEQDIIDTMPDNHRE